MKFYKYQATGNDFVFIDHRETADSLWEERFTDAGYLAQICHRRFGVGADGFILLEKSEEYDFKMRYYNSDGKESSMCGNGGRCIVAFAKKLGIISDVCTFEAIDGVHEARIEDNIVELKMIDVPKIEMRDMMSVLNTGSPHLVIPHRSLSNMDIISEALQYRNNAEFREEGINVNFVESVAPQEYRMRTYERGVEDETYSCGTGATAVALAMSPNKKGTQEVMLHTKGGELKVRLERENNQAQNIWLIGPTELVFEGSLLK